MKKTKSVIILLLITLSLNGFGSDKIKVPVFGEIPFVQKGDLYSLDLGKLGKFSFKGSIDPLSLSTSVGIDDLKMFPGATVMSVLGLQDIEMTITSKAFEIAANIDDKFKDEIVDEVKKIKVIAPVIETVFNTLEIRSSRASLTYNLSMELVGALDLNIYVFGSRLPIPKVEGAIDPVKIVKTIASKIEDVAKDELAKVGKAVANAAVESGKAIAGAFDDAMKIAKTASKHMTHKPSECDNKCVPDHAWKLSKPLLNGANLALCEFYDRTMPVLVNIQGKTPQQTEELRKGYVLEQWNQVVGKIDNDWNRIRGDRSYVSFYLVPDNAANGGRIFRSKIDEYKNRHLDARNSIWQHLMKDTKFAGPIDFYTTEVNENAQLHIRNYWNKTAIHIEHGSPKSEEISPAWASAKWIFEKVKGKNAVRIKSAWKDAYLHIETGTLGCSPIGAGALSSMWVIEDIPGSNSVRIKSLWKNTEYLHVERGRLECSQIDYGWLSARWELGYVRVAKPEPKPEPKDQIVSAQSSVKFNQQVRLTNILNQTQLNIEFGGPQCDKAAPGWLSAKWVLEPVEGGKYMRIKSDWKGTYLHVENGKVECSQAGPGWHSAMWSVHKVPNTNGILLKNRHNNTYLNIERGKLQSTEIAPGWLSAKWNIEYL